MCLKNDENSYLISQIDDPSSARSSVFLSVTQCCRVVLEIGIVAVDIGQGN